MSLCDFIYNIKAAFYYFKFLNTINSTQPVFLFHIKMAKSMLFTNQLKYHYKHYNFLSRNSVRVAANKHYSSVKELASYNMNVPEKK